MDISQTPNIISDVVHNVVISFPERASLLLAAILLVSILGYTYGTIRGKSIPALWFIFEALLGGFCDKAFKPNKDKSTLAFRGAMLFIAVMAIALSLGFLTQALSKSIYMYDVVAVISLCMLLVTGAHWTLIGKILHTLKNKKDKNSGRHYYALAASSRVDLNSVDDAGTVRTVANFSLMSFETMLVLPSLAYLCFGLMGAFMMSGIGFIMWRVGRMGAGQGSGSLASVCLKLVRIISAPITYVIFLVSCLFVPHSNILRGLKGLVTTSGYGVVSIVAYALNMILLGPAKDIDGWVINLDWRGPDKVSAKLDLDMVKRVRYLLFVTTILWGALILGLLLLYKFYIL